MARATELPIYRVIYDLVKLVTKLTQNYPRGYRQGLARSICDGAQDLAALVFQANCTTDKAPILVRLREKLAALQLQLRLSKDLHLISAGQFGDTVILTESVGKQLTNWLNHSRKSA